MQRFFGMKTSFLALVLGAIATSSSITACSTTTQTPTSSTDASSAQPIDHGNMQHSGMNHSTSMVLGPADAEFDLRFIDAMTPHHMGAVEMAKEAQQKSKRPEIQKLAASIINAQNKEIADLTQWRQAWYPKAGADAIAYNSQMGHSMPMSQDQRKSMMMNMDLGGVDDQFDLRFLNAMIPHHESAVVMAKDALNKSKRSEIKQLAQEIVTSQEAEIKQMQQWKQAWYKQ